MQKLYLDLMAQGLSAGLRLLPDKPEETLDSTLRALWHAAAGRSMSVESGQPSTAVAYRA